MFLPVANFMLSFKQDQKEKQQVHLSVGSSTYKVA